VELIGRKNGGRRKEQGWICDSRPRTLYLNTNECIYSERGRSCIHQTDSRNLSKSIRGQEADLMVLSRLAS
jgi:hypothetical protein